MTVFDVLHVPVRVPTTGPVEERIEVVRDLMARMNESKGWNSPEVRAAIKVVPFELGLTNQLYKCKLSDQSLSVEEKEMQVMVRVFGEGTDEMLDRDEELHVMQQVTENYVKCRFDNGLVVTFFVGECLRPLQLTEESVQTRIMKGAADLHERILKKYPGEELLTHDWFERLENWLKMIRKADASFTREVEGVPETLNLENMEKEGQILKAEYKKRNYEIVCTHGDLNAENCIWNSEDDSLSFIDYEYACNFFRGFDLGNHFCEFAGVERQLDFDNYYPTEETRRRLIGYYCEEAYPTLEQKDREERAEKLLVDAEFGALLSNYFWAVWGIVQSTNSSIDFDYLDYSDKRFVRYWKTKQSVFNE